MKKRGFSLAEMMIVMVIMSVMAAVAVPLITKKMKTTPVAAGAAASDPAGTVVAYAGTTLPASGWLLCDGQAVSRSTYSALFTAVGTKYGAGNGVTTFNVPNLLGRVLVGVDASSTVVTSGGANALAKVSGTENEILSLAQIPSHGHTITDGAGSHTHTTDAQGTHSHGGATVAGGGAHTHTLPFTGSASYGGGGSPMTSSSNGVVMLTGSGGSAHNHGISADGNHAHNVYAAGAHNHTVNANGGGGAHNNMQPYMALNYIIKT